MFEIKIETGDKVGSLFTDEVTVTIPPSWCEELSEFFKEKSTNCQSYNSQGFHREKADFFEKAFREWEEARRR